uniref:penicillin-binding transpeptidase domain-containing protein n=1 Tax=Megamonas funiformis TaxID=437897 RepID=UPI003AF76D0C
MFSYLSKILCVFTFCFFSVACTFAQDTNSNTNTNSTPSETTTIVDYSSYFKGINGTAIFYTPENNHYTVYNQSLSEKRSSPCSTFKIFSTYVGLSSHKLDPNNSTRKWNGTIYWNSDWHRDIDLTTAFKTSCVWYYRQLTNDIGPDIMQEYIDKFDYGNKDISDWYGETDPDDDPRDLKGFWLETSLKISPLEQVQLLNRLFSANENPMALAKLKELM